MVPHKQLVKELNTTSKKLNEEKNKILLDEEFFVQGGEMYYTDGAAKRLRVHFAEPGFLPQFEKLQVIKQCRNPRWVECARNGWKVKVAIPKRLTGKLDGKPIKVEVITDAYGNRSYRHESLSR